MASLQKKQESWHLQFTYRGQRRTWVLGPVEDTEAEATKGKVAYLLMRIKQHLLDVPAGMDIVTFLEHDGKPPLATSTTRQLPYSALRNEYLQTFGNGALESNTLYTAKIHLTHLAATLGEAFPVAGLTHADLQRHIDRRCGKDKVAGITVKKEIDTFRSAWNWAGRMGYVQGNFPSPGLTYPKKAEKLPFMTRKEIERRIKHGGTAEELWECLYLPESEIEEFLSFAQARKAPSWVYPMCVMAAHTGARRSEMIRAERQDVDFEAGVITIREKKRVRGTLTTRRVPLSTRLKEALQTLPDAGRRLFGNRKVQSVQKAFMRLVGKHKSGATNPKTKVRKETQRQTKWSVVPGWHCLRHSFISVLAARGIDQRIINEMAGHTTEAMARRYRHLVPDLKENAIKQVFG